MKIYGEINNYNPHTGLGSIIDENNNEYWFYYENVINPRINPKPPYGKVLFNINMRGEDEEDEKIREAFNVELL